MMKRILSLLLSVSVIMALAAGCAQKEETPEISPSVEPVSAEPLKAVNGNVTKAGFLAELASADGVDLSIYEGRELPFADCEQNAAIAWAWDKWLIDADFENKIYPESGLKREEAANILGKYLDYKYTDLPAGCGTGAPNMSNIQEENQNGVMKCWMYGVIDTEDEPDFQPQKGVTVEEAKAWCANTQSTFVSAIYQGDEQVFADKLVSMLKPEGNWSLSPYSIRMCLAMLANGAEGETRKELLDVLQISDLDTFNKEVESLLSKYEEFSDVITLNTANSLWLNQDSFNGQGVFLQKFEKEMSEKYQAVTEEVTNKDSVERVNTWVKEKTNAKIPSILSDSNREFAAAVVNAVYFKGAWEDEFDEWATEKANFHNADGATSQVDMMHQTSSVGFYSTPGIESIKLDFQNYLFDEETFESRGHSNADFSMYFILADDGLDVQNFLDQAQFENEKVKISLPKFKLEGSYSLKDTLAAMGIEEAFDSQSANFSNMVDPSAASLFVDSVLHKTYVAIDEKGAEAAAVTAATMECTSVMIEREPLIREFTADKPFYFAIRDNESGTILFVGKYNKVEA